MTTYTRLTLIGSDRRADMVVPDGEPVAAMLPDILRLLEHTPGPVMLTTRAGDQLDAELSLTEQDIADGTPLWVTALDAAPPPAQVTDIADLTTAAHDTRPDAWNPEWTLGVASPVAAALVWFAGRDLTQIAAVSVLAGVVLVACVLARLGKTPLAVLAAAVGVGLAIDTALTLPDAKTAWLVGLACFGLAVAVVALVGIVGFGDRALGVGGATGAVLVLVAFAIVEAGASSANAAATVAVLGVGALSIAPGIAMTASGLTGLDDRLVTGEESPRARAQATVDAAYRSLTCLVVATTVVVSVCAAVTAASTPWGRWLAVAVIVVVVLRMRVFPLVPQRIVLVVGALAVALALLTGLASGPATTGALGALVVVAVSWARPSPVAIARMNRLADVVETVSVVALVPLLLASWGVFADLAGAFG